MYEFPGIIPSSSDFMPIILLLMMVSLYMYVCTKGPWYIVFTAGIRTVKIDEGLKNKGTEEQTHRDVCTIGENVLSLSA